MLRRLVLIALALISVFAIACSGGGDIEPADSYDSLAAALESAGMNIDDLSEKIPIFRALLRPGRRVHGERTNDSCMRIRHSRRSE